MMRATKCSVNAPFDALQVLCGRSVDAHLHASSRARNKNSTAKPLLDVGSLILVNALIMAAVIFNGAWVRP